MAFNFAAAFAVFLAASANPGNTAATAPASAQQSVPLIEPAALKAMMASGVRLVLVDVRRPEEFAAGHIEGAMLMPLDTLEANFAKLPRDVKLVVYCHSGRRSAQAVQLLLTHGYSRAVSLHGGITAWSALAK
jgi:rhodanese-related sulfurtransferase